MKHIKTFENYNNIEIAKSGGLNCDNPNCDWSDMSIEVSDYKNWVNKPCPECGESLLTQEDYDKTVKFMDAINLINSIPPDQLEELSKNFDTDDIIDAYLKLKELGYRLEGGDNDSTRVNFN